MGVPSGPDLLALGDDNQELEEAGRWAKGSSIPRKVYVRPAEAGKKDPFDKVPVHNPAATAED